MQAGFEPSLYDWGADTQSTLHREDAEKTPGNGRFDAYFPAFSEVSSASSAGKSARFAGSWRELKRVGAPSQTWILGDLDSNQD